MRNMLIFMVIGLLLQKVHSNPSIINPIGFVRQSHITKPYECVIDYHVKIRNFANMTLATFRITYELISEGDERYSHITNILSRQLAKVGHINHIHHKALVKFHTPYFFSLSF